MLRPFLLLLMIFLPSSLMAQTIYLKPAEALKIIFKDSKEVVSDDKTLSPGEKAGIEKKLGSKLAKETWKVFVAKSDGKIDGYALIDSEVGKTEPITFITAVNPDGTVKEVEILVCREPIGSEVHEKNFLKQYQGKKSADPIRIGQDIANISGATMSARAVTQGVRRALTLWQAFYGGSK